MGQHDAYLATADPAAARAKSGILYVPDVLGIYGNAMLLADQFAAQGYTTLIVEPFYGDKLELNELPNMDLQKWIATGRNGSGPHTTREIDPIIQDAVAYMRNKLGMQNIGAVGYCFGAKYVVRHYSSGIKAGYIAHPSFVDEEELAAISGPLSIAAAETDAIFPLEKRHESERILQQNGNVYQINLYSGVAHGFAVKCNLEEKQQRISKELAFKQAVDFFNYYL